MEFAPFHLLFPEISKIETRSITVFNNPDLPDGNYGFLPSFCMDKKCDCRRAFINVVSEDMPEKLATISYGWESFGFYRKWSKGMTDEEIRIFAGPALDPYQPQGKYAPALLELVKNSLLNDENYVQRIKRHYTYFKRKRGMKLTTDLTSLLQITDSCPCKSGKTFIFCCGKKSRRLRR